MLTTPTGPAFAKGYIVVISLKATVRTEENPGIFVATPKIFVNATPGLTTKMIVSGIATKTEVSQRSKNANAYHEPTDKSVKAMTRSFIVNGIHDTAHARTRGTVDGMMSVPSDKYAAQESVSRIGRFPNPIASYALVSPRLDFATQERLALGKAMPVAPKEHLRSAGPMSICNQMALVSSRIEYAVVSRISATA